MSSPPGPGHLFAISLIDGLSYAEEPVTVAIDRGLDGIPLVGGSAGDNLEFKTTRQNLLRAELFSVMRTVTYTLPTAMSRLYQ